MGIRKVGTSIAWPQVFDSADIILRELGLKANRKQKIYYNEEPTQFCLVGSLKVPLKGSKDIVKKARTMESVTIIRGWERKGLTNERFFYITANLRVKPVWKGATS